MSAPRETRRMAAVAWPRRIDVRALFICGALPSLKRNGRATIAYNATGGARHEQWSRRVLEAGRADMEVHVPTVYARHDVAADTATSAIPKASFERRPRQVRPAAIWILATSIRIPTISGGV
jgi:hypothetical protein